MVLTTENASRVIAGLNIRKATRQFLGTFICLYGQGGSGKTTLAAELYKLGKTLHIDAEGGTDSIEHLVDEENLDIVDVKNWREFDRVCVSLARDLQDYEGIVVDNLCEIIDLCEIHHGIEGDGSHDLQKYKLVKKDIMEKIRFFRDLCRTRAITVIICAWDADEKDEGTKIIKKDLAFTPALRKDFPGICTIIGHIGVTHTPEIRVLDFAPSPKTVAKFKRSADSAAQKIPWQIYYKVDNLPLVDILQTMRGEINDWPAKKYPDPRVKSST